MLAIGGLAGAALLWELERSLPAIRAWVLDGQASSPARAGVLLTALGSALALPLFGLSWFLWRLGRRISRAQRFPPPSMSVVRDTRVLVGPAADARARAVTAAAIILAALALGLLATLWRLASVMRSSGS